MTGKQKQQRKSQKRKKAPAKKVAPSSREPVQDAVDEVDDDADDNQDDDEVLVPELVAAPSGVDDEDSTEDVDRELEATFAPPPSADERMSLRKRDPLSAYVQETRKYPLLSREEEHELAVQYAEEGDLDAARRLVEANLRLVVKIAYEYRRAHRNLLDLVQEGNVGLMQAVRKYDPHRGVKLSTYAAWWIRAYILKFVLNNWRLVKIGTTQAQRKLFFNLRKEKEKLEQLGFQPGPALLAERLDVREKDVIEMEKRLAAPDASFDAPIAGGEGEAADRTRHDVMAAERSERPDVQVANQEFQSILVDKLSAFADTLSGREETIFRERWLTDTPLTLQEIGDRYGVSRERARQIEKRMLNRLREYLEAELGTAVDIDSLSRE